MVCCRYEQNHHLPKSVKKIPYHSVEIRYYVPYDWSPIRCFLRWYLRIIYYCKGSLRTFALSRGRKKASLLLIRLIF
jgi:hypothetical protein